MYQTYVTVAVAGWGWGAGDGEDEGWWWWWWWWGWKGVIIAVKIYVLVGGGVCTGDIWSNCEAWRPTPKWGDQLLVTWAWDSRPLAHLYVARSPRANSTHYPINTKSNRGLQIKYPSGLFILNWQETWRGGLSVWSILRTSRPESQSSLCGLERLSDLVESSVKTFRADDW